MMFALIGYAITGILTGLIAGILGVGGGIIVVPALLFIFSHIASIPNTYAMQIAAGTSMAIMSLTAQSAVKAHMQLKAIVWPHFKNLWPGILFGTIAGVIMASLIRTDMLRIILACFLLIIVMDMLFNITLSKSVGFPSRWLNLSITGLMGFISGLLGIGGGVLVVPYLSYSGVQRRQVASISALCTLLISIVGTIACIIVGINAIGWSGWRVGFIYLPAVIGVAIPSMIFAAIGARLHYLLPTYYLRYLFIAVLLIAALNLLK